MSIENTTTTQFDAVETNQVYEAVMLNRMAQQPNIDFWMYYNIKGCYYVSLALRLIVGLTLIILISRSIRIKGDKIFETVVNYVTRSEKKDDNSIQMMKRLDKLYPEHYSSIKTQFTQIQTKTTTSVLRRMISQYLPSWINIEMCFDVEKMALQLIFVVIIVTGFTLLIDFSIVYYNSLTFPDEFTGILGNKLKKDVPAFCKKFVKNFHETQNSLMDESTTCQKFYNGADFVNYMKCTKEAMTQQTILHEQISIIDKHCIERYPNEIYHKM